MPQIQTPPVFRFAPSPNGHLHLGHAYSALLNERLAREADGKLLLRIEDVDRQRSRQEFEASIVDDLNWLGIAFDETPRRQSDYLHLYESALKNLIEREFAYPSTISRSEIAALAVSNPNWRKDPDGAFLSPVSERECKNVTASHAIRLNMDAALAACALPITWQENGKLEVFDASLWGDVVLKSRDGSFAYHLAVVVDDNAQNVTNIVRGRDLYAATAIHLVLQTLLGFKTPSYWHHDLILDQAGEKLAKSRNSPTLQSLRQKGETGDQLRQRLGFSA
jgi:glutamyl-Q tRNA(Asp) synthetase